MLLRIFILLLLGISLLETKAYADDKDKALHFVSGYAISFTMTKVFQVIGIKKGPAAILGTLTGIGATIGKELADPYIDRDDLRWGCYGSAASGIVSISLDILD